MFSNKTLVIFVISFFVISFGTFTQAGSIIPNGFSFQKNIKLGETVTPDVSYLQYFLNQYPSTKVADTGPGSNSNLTNYYGNKTSDAVKRFQNLYAVEILKPAGLTIGTGFFGENTRKKINSLLATLGIVTTSTPPNKPTTTSRPPNITSVFSEQSFTQDSTQPNKPSVSGIYPNLVYTDQDEISIYGFNFTNIDNIVYGTIGSIENLKAQNNTIKIKLRDFSNFNSASKYYSGTTTQIYFKVSNIRGVSTELASVRYTFPNIGNYNNQFGADGGEDKSNDSDTNSLGMVDVSSIDKEIHGFSPDGAIIKLIGGEETFDTMYGYSPSGVILGGGISGAMSGGAGGGGGAGGAGGGASVDNFGGEVTNITECTCSGGRLVTIRDVRGDTKDLFYGYGRSTLHEEYNLSTSVNVVGGYTQSGTTCEVYNGESCDTQGTAIGDIDFPRGVGTSLSSGK